MDAARDDPMFSQHLASIGPNFVTNSVVPFDEFEGEELLAQAHVEIFKQDSGRIEECGPVQQVLEETPVVAPEPPETLSEPRTEPEAVDEQQREHKTDGGVVGSLCGHNVLPGAAVISACHLVLETSGVYRLDPSLLAGLMAQFHVDQELADEPVDPAVNTVSEANGAAAAAPTNNPVAAPSIDATVDSSVSASHHREVDQEELPEWDRCGARPKTFVPRSVDHLFGDESSDDEERSPRRPTTSSKRRTNGDRRRDDEVQLVTLPSSFAKADDVNDDLPTSIEVPLPVVSPTALSGSCSNIPAHIADWTVSDDEETVEGSSPSVSFRAEEKQMNQEVKVEQQQQGAAANCLEFDGVFSGDELSLEESGIYSKIDEARSELQSMVHHSSSLVSAGELPNDDDSQLPNAHRLDDIMAELQGARQMVDRSLSSASLMNVSSLGTALTMTYNGVVVYGLMLHNGTQHCWKEVMQRAAASRKLQDLQLDQFTGRLTNGVEITIDDDVPNVSSIEVNLERVFDGDTGDATWNWKVDSDGHVWYRNVPPRFSLD